MQSEHLHYPESFIPTGLVPMDGRYEVTWYEADEDWEWVRLLRETHEVTLPPPEPNVSMGIHMQYDTTVVVAIGVDNPRREEIANVSLNFLVPDTVSELTPADQSGGRVPMPGAVMTTSEVLTDDDGNPHGESKYWSQEGIRFSGRMHSVMYFRATFPEPLKTFPVKLVLVAPDLDSPIVVHYTIRPQPG